MKALTEMVVATTLTAMVLTQAINLTMYTTPLVAKRQAQVQVTQGARRGVDEMLYILRNGGKVLASYTSGTTTYTTGGNQIVFQSPAYNAQYTGFFLPDSYDIHVIKYDKTSKILYESIFPENNSSRSSRKDYKLLNKVLNFTCSYIIEENFSLPTGNSNKTFTLGGTPIGNFYLYAKKTDGTVVSLSSNTFSISNKTLIVNNAPSGSVLTLVYNSLPESSILERIISINIKFNSVNYENESDKKYEINMENTSRLRNFSG